MEKFSMDLKQLIVFFQRLACLKLKRIEYKCINMVKLVI